MDPSPNLVKQLFEQHVPEILQGLVQIRGIARDAHSLTVRGRTKIAVSSEDPDLDAVGACVGPRATRIEAITRALHGERIDIVPWDESPPRFVSFALAPARLKRIVVDEDARAMDVIVDDDQLSLAVGVAGVNLRLAAELTGWALRVRSVSVEDARRGFADQSLGSLPGITPELVAELYRYGYAEAKHVADDSPQRLAEVPGLNPADVLMLQVHARRQAAADDEARRLGKAPLIR